MEMRMGEKVEKLPVREEKLSPVQRLAKLDQERAEILATAKGEALQKANEAVDELNALGFHYLLCEEGDQPKNSKKGEPSDAPCVLCGFKTIPPHDKRSHKTHPGPFNEEDLKLRKMVKA
jgi:hypothetical protein